MQKVHSESLIRLSDVPKLKWLPAKQAGKRLHLSTVYRWCQRGLRGMRLETIQCGGTRCTTEAALSRFFHSLSESQLVPSDFELDSVRTSAAAKQTLDDAGVGITCKERNSK